MADFYYDNLHNFSILYQNFGLPTIKNKNETSLSSSPSSSPSSPSSSSSASASTTSTTHLSSSLIHTEQIVDERNCFNTAELEAVPSRIAQWFLILIYSLTSFLALIGNITVIVVEICGKESAQNIRKYLINLAISDITIGVLCVPFTYTDFMLGQWIFPHWLCPTAQFVQLLSVFVTSSTLTFIGIERYMATLHPFSSIHHWLENHTHIMLGLTWVFGILYAFIPFENTATRSFQMADNQTYYECSYDNGVSLLKRRLFMTSNFVLTFILPLSVLIFSYSAIMRKLIHDQKRFRQSSQIYSIKFKNTKNNVEKKLAKNSLHRTRSEGDGIQNQPQHQRQRKIENGDDCYLDPALPVSMLAMKELDRSCLYSHRNLNLIKEDGNCIHECNLSDDGIGYIGGKNYHFETSFHNETNVSPSTENKIDNWLETIATDREVRIDKDVNIRKLRDQEHSIRNNRFGGDLKNFNSTDRIDEMQNIDRVKVNNFSIKNSIINADADDGIEKDPTNNIVHGHLSTSNIDLRKSGPLNLRSKTIKMMFTVILLYGICWMPIKLYQFLLDYGLISYCTENELYAMVSLFFLCHWMAMANSFVNPIIYSFMSKSFRNDFTKISQTFRQTFSKNLNQLSIKTVSTQV
ncbi:isoleucine-tRNA ligase [Sarcoptes scabiei]|nr:isoleucine-tRNA ligase [Sarcoptes scabiei]